MAHLYWRIYISATQDGTYAGLGEVEFRATVGGADQASGGTPFASSAGGGDPATNAFDNNTGTAWATVSSGIPAYIGYQFASPVDVIEISMTSRSGAFWTQAPTRFVVQYSDLGVTYTDAFEGITGWTGALQTQTFAAPPAAAETVATVGMHTVVGGPSSVEGVASLVMHTAVGAAVSEEWVSALAMHTVRGGRVGMAAVDMIAMHTVFGPGTPVPANQRIRVSLVCRTRAVA